MTQPSTASARRAPRWRTAIRAGPAPFRPAASYAWAQRDEEYAILGANVVVELNSGSRARHPTTRAWAIIRRADRTSRLLNPRSGRGVADAR